jgi:DNA-binding CsgD family transcriptional regulator/tetratricopeptide (TPR) repeat protein
MAVSPLGREAELLRLTEVLGTVGDGPVGVLIEGEAGIGKTTVWRAAIEQATGFGWTLLETRPLEADSKLTFAGLRDLLAPTSDSLLFRLPAPQRQALQQALLLAEIVPGQRVDRQAVAAGATSLVGLLASRGPLVLAIDDVQWLDGPSARVLAHIVARLADLQVALIITIRSDGEAQWPLGLPRSIPAGRLTKIRLGPLSTAALHHVFIRHLGRSFPRRVLVQIQHATGGNPFFALEVARLLPSREKPGPFLPVPPNLQGLVSDRISRLPPSSRQALLAVACLSTPTLDLVRRSMDGTPTEGRRAIERAEADGVIAVTLDEGVRFTHPLLAATVYTRATGPDRREMHRRLAGAVNDVEQRAIHLALATAEPDAGVAATLAAAAETAARRGAPDAAADLMERAMRLTPPRETHQRAARAIEAATYHYHGGEFDRARGLLRGLEDVGVPGSKARILSLLGEISYHQESFDEAVSLYERALRHTTNDPLLEARIELNLSFGTVASGDHRMANAHAERARQLAEGLDDSMLLGQAIAASVMTRYLLGGDLDETGLALALDFEDWNRPSPVVIRPTLIAGYLFLYDGRLDHSRAALEAAYRELVERGLESDIPFIAAYLAWLGILSGRLAEAGRYATEAVDAATRVGSDSIRAYALGFLSLVLAHRGQIEAAREAVAETFALVEATGFRIGALWAAWTLGIIGSALGDAASVHQALADLTAFVEEHGLDEPIRAPFLADEIEALVALGESDRADRLLRMMERGSRNRLWVHLTVARGRALLYASQSQLDDARATISRALADPRIGELPIEWGRCLLVLAQVERRARKRGAARQALLSAQALFQRSEAGLWLERVRSDLARLGLEPARDRGLTPSEDRIAHLVATGLTNREVAARLLISPKTVEATLARVYDKLAISSRAELGGLVGQRGSATPLAKD